MYIESDKTIKNILSDLNDILEYKSWKSLPKLTEGNVNGNFLYIKVKGIIYWSGRGEYRGEVKSINGKSVIVGNLNSKLLATILPLLFMLIIFILFPSIWSDNDALFKLAGFGISGSLFGNWLVRKDHSKIINLLEGVAEHQ